MANERYPQDDYHNHTEPQDYGRDYGSGRAHSYSSARDYQAADSDRGRTGDHGRDDDSYGRRDYGSQRYGQREQGGRSYGETGSGAGGYSQNSYDRGGYGRDDDRSSGREFSSHRDSGYYQDRSQPGRTGYGQSSYGRDSYGQGGYGRSGYGRDRGSFGEYRGSYASDNQRFEDVGRGRDDDRGRGRQGYGRQPQGYNYEERGFLDRAGDEVRSWFGDEDAERRREADARRDERQSGDQYGWGGSGSRAERDGDYHSWRRSQMEALDRDYDEYRQHNRSKFENEFSTWRTSRQGQRDLLNKIDEHQDVVGSDGEHVGTVDKVRGDRVILTKNDKDAGGHHHSFPSSWLQSVDDKVTLSKTASEAKSAWRDEERKGAMFQDGGSSSRSDAGAYGGQSSGRQAWGSQASSGQTTGASAASSSSATGQTTGDKDTDPNRSFSGTY